MEKQNRTLGKLYEAPEAEGILLVPFDDFVTYGQTNPQSTEEFDGFDDGTWR